MVLVRSYGVLLGEVKGGLLLRAYLLQRSAATRPNAYSYLAYGVLAFDISIHDSTRSSRAEEEQRVFSNIFSKNRTTVHTSSKPVRSGYVSLFEKS